MADTTITKLKQNMDAVDDLVNSNVATVTTPDGRVDKTFSEIQRQANEILANLGLEYPPIAYVAGLTVERNTQTYRYNDVVYVNTRSDLPFTTTGAFDEGGWQIVQQINQSTVIFTSDGIKGLEDVALIDRAVYSVSGFYAGTEVGGGDFVYDASRDKADHDGVQVISPESIAAWDGTQANVSTFTGWTGTGTGAFVRVQKEEIPNLKNYIPYVGTDNLWNTALNKALDAGAGACYAPGGDPYRIENFTRSIRPGNNNVGQESVRIVGDKTGYTVNHQFMIAKTVFEGNGNLFLDVVNYAFENVGVRNISSTSRGALFTLYGQGLEAGSFIGCYFGLCDYHFYNPESNAGNPDSNDYLIGPYFKFCAFFHAHIMSRYLGGQSAAGSEERCYTSHCQAGVYQRAPGPCYAINNSVFEYMNDYAIDIFAFGSVANYSKNLKSVFFETCGGGRANIPGKTSSPKAQATPSIAIRSQTNPSGAPIEIDHSNLFFTYTDSASKPIAWIYIDSNTARVRGNKTLAGANSTQDIYTSDELTLVDPFTGTGNILEGDRNIFGSVDNGALFEHGEGTNKEYDKFAGGQLYNYGRVTTDGTGSATFTLLEPRLAGSFARVQVTPIGGKAAVSALVNNESSVAISTEDFAGNPVSQAVDVIVIGKWK